MRFSPTLLVFVLTLALVVHAVVSSLSAPCPLPSPPAPPRRNPLAKVLFITAIYGAYEQTCKPFAPQSVPAHFVCFTDKKSAIRDSNGWHVVDAPYHDIFPSPLDDGGGGKWNSLRQGRNRHSFNRAKYYKQAFRNIPWTKDYEVVVWIDGTIEIQNEDTAYWLLEMFARDEGTKIITWEHTKRGGLLKNEVADSNFVSYNAAHWNGQDQPIQDVAKQYDYYLSEGYDEGYFKRLHPSRPNVGVWVTCFVAVDNRSEEVAEFLDLWYLQTLEHTTQDQVSFSYAVQKSGIAKSVLTLPSPDNGSSGTVEVNNFFVKHNHNK